MHGNNALATQVEIDPHSLKRAAGAEADIRTSQVMEAVVSRLEGLAEDQVRRKVSIEDRWLEDLRQYHGRYDPTTESNLKAANKSQLFVNQTRSKTLAWEARLSDMLFPTDDRNWGIQPTPVPELADEAKKAAEQAAKLTDQANEAVKQGDPASSQALAGQANEQAQRAAMARAIMDEARTRAEAMEREIDDQFREAEYNVESRMVIHDGCKLGTGVMKGPVGSAKLKRVWAKNQEGQYALTEVPDPRPDWKRVDPWNYFPDMSAARANDKEFDFERHLMTKSELRKLAKLPGFDKDAIRELLKDEPAKGLPDYVNKLRDLTGVGQNDGDQRYQVWEYHGPLAAEDLRALCECKGDDTMAEAMEEDPLDEYHVVVWFCQGKLLKFGMHHLDSGESIYSVFNLEKDDQSIFGFGVPYLMRDSQKAINGGWRMMMDNAGLSTGPQIVINSGLIEPQNGKWELGPRKIWTMKDKTTPIANAFGAFNVDSRQMELMNIITAAKQFADDETNLPLVAQGESGANQTTTANGMAMLMNASNVVFRRVVKSFDDDFSVPNVRRAYDWNMQFSNKDEIKGDFAVDARGSSVLLVRELQGQNLMAIATNWSAHPVLGGLVKAAPLARKTLQAHMIAADEVIYTDDELAENAQKAAEAAQQGGGQDPAMMVAQVQLQIAQLDAQTKLQVAQLNRDTAMMKLAEDRNMQIEDLATKLDMHNRKIESDERRFAAEAALKTNQGSGI
jgi:hypothetical protein